MYKFLDLDFETKSKADLLKVGAAKYAQDPSTKIIISSFQAWGMKKPINFSPALPRYSRRLNKLNHCTLKSYLKKISRNPDRYKIRAHHSEFEYWNYNENGVLQFDWPPLPIEAFYCTMSVSGANSYPAAEEKAAIAMNLSEQKDAEGKRLMKMFSNPSRKEGELFKDPNDYPNEFRGYIDYCDQDVRTQRAIVDHCQPLSPFQEQIFFLTEKMNIRGLPIDLRMCRGAIKLAKKYHERSDVRVQEITGKEITSAKQTVALTDWLNRVKKAKVPNLKAQTVERLLKKTNLDPVVRELLEIRQGVSKSSTSKYVKALEMSARNGRVHGSLKAYLTITGRWAGRGLQIHNFSKPNGKVFPDWSKYDIEYLCKLIARSDIDAIEQAFGNVMEVLKGATRSMIRAPKGYKLITADYSQVEARITMWLANCKQGLSDFGGDGLIYEKMAGTIFETSYTNIVKGHWQRDLGKETVLGCGFGMGKEKFFVTCTLERGLDITRDIANRGVDSYRERYPEVPQAWKDCEKAAIKAMLHKGRSISVLNGRLEYRYIKGALRCKLPSGRFIYYPEACYKLGPNHFGGQSEQIFYKNWKDTRGAGKQWDYTSIWGGIFFQHAVQGSAGDLIGYGLLNVEKAGYDVIFTVHDEGASLVPIGFGNVPEYQRLLCETEEWAKGIPLIAEGWEGPRYKK